MVDTMLNGGAFRSTRIQCCIQPTSGYNGYNDTMYLKLVSLISILAKRLVKGRNVDQWHVFDRTCGQLIDFSDKLQYRMDVSGK